MDSVRGQAHSTPGARDNSHSKTNDAYKDWQHKCAQKMKPKHVDRPLVEDCSIGHDFYQSKVHIKTQIFFQGRFLSCQRILVTLMFVQVMLCDSFTQVFNAKIRVKLCVWRPQLQIIHARRHFCNVALFGFIFVKWKEAKTCPSSSLMSVLEKRPVKGYALRDDMTTCVRKGIKGQLWFQ